MSTARLVQALKNYRTAEALSLLKAGALDENAEERKTAVELLAERARDLNTLKTCGPIHLIYSGKLNKAEEELLAYCDENLAGLKL